MKEGAWSIMCAFSNGTLSSYQTKSTNWATYCKNPQIELKARGLTTLCGLSRMTSCPHRWSHGKHREMETVVSRYTDYVTCFQSHRVITSLNIQLQHFWQNMRILIWQNSMFIAYYIIWVWSLLCDQNNFNSWDQIALLCWLLHITFYITNRQRLPFLCFKVVLANTHPVKTHNFNSNTSMIDRKLQYIILEYTLQNETKLWPCIKSQ